VPTDQTITAARPEVRVDGSKIDDLTDGLEVMRIHEGRETPATLELQVGNWGTPAAGGSPDFRFLDRRQLDFGKRIEVVHGSSTIFRGRITGLEVVFPRSGIPALVVLAEDELQVLRLARRTRTFENVSDEDVVRSVAGDHSLTANVDLPGPTHACVAQLDQSDLAFLRDRVRAVGGELWVRDGELHAAQRPSRAGSGRPPKLRLNQEVSELRVRADLAHQATEVVVGGWDVSAAQAIAEKAGDSVLGAEAQDGDTGATILQRAFGARVQTVAAAAPRSTAEAQARAAAIFRARARRFLRGEAVCVTSGALSVGAKVTLEGAGAPFSGDYQLIEVVHRFDAATGARSEIMFERAVLKVPEP
jgi:phage protein D